MGDDRGGPPSVAWSTGDLAAVLFGRRLPQFEPASFRIRDPGKLAVLRFLDPLHGSARLLQLIKHSTKVGNAIVDHEGRGRHTEVRGVLRKHRPYGLTLLLRRFMVSPPENRIAVFTHDPQILPIPRRELRGVLRFEEDATDALDLFHGTEFYVSLQRAASNPVAVE